MQIAETNDVGKIREQRESQQQSMDHNQANCSARWWIKTSSIFARFCRTQQTPRYSPCLKSRDTLRDHVRLKNHDLAAICERSQTYYADDSLNFETHRALTASPFGASASATNAAIPCAFIVEIVLPSIGSTIRMMPSSALSAMAEPSGSHAWRGEEYGECDASVKRVVMGFRP